MGLRDEETEILRQISAQLRGDDLKESTVFDETFRTEMDAAVDVAVDTVVKFMSGPELPTVMAKFVAKYVACLENEGFSHEEALRLACAMQVPGQSK